MSAVTYDFEEGVSDTESRLIDAMAGEGMDDADTARRPTKHEIVCRHWLRGTCIKEWQCDFLHIYDDARMPFCRNQKRHGRCHERLLGLCPLKHVDNQSEAAAEAGGASNFASSAGGPPNVPQSSDVCLRYLFGYCPNGPMCHLKHTPLPRSQLPNAALPDWYLGLIINHPSTIPPLKEDERRRSTQIWQQLLIASSNASAEPGSAPATATIKTIESLLPPYCLTPNARYQPGGPPMKVRCFVIKSGKIENILTSVQRGIWATGKGNMDKLKEAWETCDNVILLMSANESGGFQGYARMASGFDETLYPRIWGSFSNKLSPNFRVQWVKQAKLDFEALAAFTNPWNDNKPLKKSRDGQEMPIDLAEAICSRLHALPSEALLVGTPLQNLPRINHESFFLLTPQQQLEEEIRLQLRQPPPAAPPPAQKVMYRYPLQKSIVPQPILPQPVIVEQPPPHVFQPAKSPPQRKKRPRPRQDDDVNPYLLLARR